MAVILSFPMFKNLFFFLFVITLFFSCSEFERKTEKELARSKAQKAKLNQDIQDILQSDQIQNIINSSVSKEEAQSKINAFIK